MINYCVLKTIFNKVLFKKINDGKHITHIMLQYDLYQFNGTMDQNIGN